jgi:hypothetical protein
VSTTDPHDQDAAKPSFRDSVTAGLVQKALEPLLRAVREEVAAARREVGARAKGARTGLVLTGAAVAFALTTLVLLAGFVVALLALALPVWAAAGITLAVFAVVTGVLAAVGVRGIRRGVPPVPKDTLRAAKDRVTRTSDEAVRD